MRCLAALGLATTLMACSGAQSGETQAMDSSQSDALNGVRPRQIPENWVGTPTRSSSGWRWDDPTNPGNSVRILRGVANDPDPAHRENFVIVVRDGQVLGRDGNPVTDADVIAEALAHD